MREANKVILNIYNSNDWDIKLKKDNSPVTKADFKAQKILVSGLEKITPNIPVVSEENPNSLIIPKSHSMYWLIDPLDGTKEFLKRNGEFTCNVALVENTKPALGFVSVPVSGEVYFGGKEFGSFLENKHGKKSSLRHKKQKGITRVIASVSHLNKETECFIKNITGKTKIIQAGSSLKFLKIATGKADIYPRLAPTCEWDTCAAHAILEGVSGEVLQVKNNKPLVYGKKNILNPHFIAFVK